MDPNQDLRDQLAAARQKLADVKADGEKSAEEKEAAAVRATLQAELDSVGREIEYEQMAQKLTALTAQALGATAPVAATVAAPVAVPVSTPAPAAPAQETKGV